MELEAVAYERPGHPPVVRYRCPLTLGKCASAGWMTGGAIWQHLRGFGHVMDHADATDAIAEARAKALARLTTEEQ